MNARIVALLSLLVLGALIWMLLPNPPASSDSGDPLVLYCAAGMRPAVEKIIDQYREECDREVEIEYGGSGALLSQIRAAGKGDLYLPASQSYVEQATELGLIDEFAHLATQRAVIVVRKDAEVTKDVDSLASLLASEARIVLASPEATAIGRATKKMLESSGEWESLWQRKLGTVETVNTVANHVETDVADAGVIWDSTASLYPNFRMIRAPAFEEKPKRIHITVLQSTKQAKRALHLFRYISARDKGIEQFASFCREVADGDTWSESPKLLVFAGGLNRPAIEDTIDAFEQREGVSVTDSYNGCGALVGQMKGGSVPDLYFACDVTFMEMVADLFPESFEVSGTDMVLISSKELSGEPVDELADLEREGLKVGVCSPVQSALGALSKQLLERHSLWKAIQPNVRDTPPTADVLVAKVVAGGLDAAIVYRANTTRQADSMNISSIDDDNVFAIQPIAVAAKSPNRNMAKRLMARIVSNESSQRFRDLGFEWRVAGSNAEAPTDVPNDNDNDK